MKVLLTGIAGRFGRTVTTRLIEEGHTVVGIDKRAWDNPVEGVETYQVDIRKRGAEDVFRKHQPNAVVHMATVTHVLHRDPDQFRINLYGTRAMIDYCHRYGVEQTVFIGRHTYYGASADSPLYHTEDEPPIAAHAFPELADLVAADLYACSAIWRHPQISTSILRFCYTLGPSKHGTLAAFLRGQRVPTVLGFDPLFQFIHEQDAAEAIVSALRHKLHGVFNVAGPPPVPLSIVIRETGRLRLAVPETLLNLALGRFGLPKLSQGAVEHIKYPIVVDDTAFRSATNFHHRFDERQTLHAFSAI